MKKQIQSYQQEKYPELVHSIVEHGKGRQTANERKQLPDVAFIEKELQEVFTETVSKDEAVELLQKRGVEVYSRKGEAVGVVYNGRKYRFMRFGLHVPDHRLKDRTKGVSR